ncbi:hypothetical protein [Pedobacter steynii]
MRKTHLTEQELQDYIQKLPQDLELVRHVTKCNHCQRQINAYQQVYRFLADSESPALEFDPVDLIPATFGKAGPAEKEHLWFLPSIVVGTILCLITGSFLLWPYVKFIFTGNTSFALVIGFSVGILLMIAGLFELLNSYSKHLVAIDKKSRPTKFNINI